MIVIKWQRVHYKIFCMNKFSQKIEENLDLKSRKISVKNFKIISLEIIYKLHENISQPI